MHIKKFESKIKIGVDELELHHFRGAGAVMFCSSGDSGSNP
jgi:hypothetical protein